MRLFLTLLTVLCCAASLARAANGESTTIAFDKSTTGSTLVADSAAQGKKALAIDVVAINGTLRLVTPVKTLPTGRYRATYFGRLFTNKNDDMSRLRVELNLGDGRTSRAVSRVVWTQFDAGQDRYTPLVQEFTLPAASSPTFDVSWQQVSTGPTDKVAPIRKDLPPAAPKDVVAKKDPLASGDDLLAELKEDVATPLTSIDYPALVLDQVVIEPISRTHWIEKVHPQFVHVYPAQANPIQVEIRNFERQDAAAEVQLEIRAGLDEVLHTATQQVSLASSGTTSCQFDWPGGQREFGHEARVTLLVGGKRVHTASEYFSVSFPIWKTALQGSGFLDWYNRFDQFDDHVASNRRNYLNVEEAFSWQPSSWTDLTPEGDHWWSGQGDAHNTRAGLEKWIGLSHKEGIKMITYLWPTASGREAMDWLRGAPELATHSKIGLPTEFFDVEDLRLKPLIEANPRLWRLRSGIWNYLGVNRGMLRSIEKGMGETIASAKQFGWDGARFDSPPGWSAMSGEDMHAEFKKLNVEPLMRKLIPEYFEQKTGEWTSEAVSVTNMRYARHRLQEGDPRFALSFNFGGEANVPKTGMPSKFFDECCAQGGQIMDEEIRSASQATWLQYRDRILRQTESIRKRGGYHCVVSPNMANNVTRAFGPICLFVGGSHPYLEYGWGSPSPGKYTQFMTRYGEYCWSPDLELVGASETSFTVDGDETLWWKELIRHRQLSGSQQWVVNLVSQPPGETLVSAKPGVMQPWRQGLAVGRQSTTQPEVWALTAEPTTQATKLAPKKVGDRYVVEVPEHRCWTMLVWTEGAK